MQNAFSASQLAEAKNAIRNFVTANASSRQIRTVVVDALFSVQRQQSSALRPSIAQMSECITYAKDVELYRRFDLDVDSLLDDEARS